MLRRLAQIVNILPKMYYLRHRGLKCHRIDRNVLDYLGASDEENINFLDLSGELSFFYGWKNPVYTRKDKICLVC